MRRESAENQTRQPWIIAAGQEAETLEKLCNSKVEERISQSKFKRADLEYIRRLSLPAVKGSLAISDIQLEKLRRLCQLAEIELVPAKITSHRPFIGPVIVTAKKVLFSILKVLLKDTIRKQRDFNAAVISYLAESGKLDK